MKQPLIRIGTGLALVLSVLAAGAMTRSAWVILPLALIYTAAFILGRWQSWRTSLKSDLLLRVVSNVLSTFAVQTVLVALLYLIGRGAASVMGRTASAVLSSWDFFYCLAVAAIGIGLGSFVAWCERDNYSAVAPTSGSIAMQKDEIKLLPTPITPENFYHGIHYSHGTYEGPERTFVSTPNTKSAGTNEKIAAAQQRLGVSLPEGLKTLYRFQNGGSVHCLCTVKPGIIEPHLYDDIILPFSGYDDLSPTENLRTVFDSVTDYADPDDENQAESFPEGCKKMIILAQWYRETLFLDYNAPGAPKLGFVNFDHAEPWQTQCVWWDNFEVFFSELRVYDTV